MTTISPQVAVIDFHHARGPEVEFWIHPDGEALSNGNDWTLLPFMALSDGAHAMTEEFSYFTLLDKEQQTENNPETEDAPNPDPGVGSTSLFGISCTRQIRSEQLRRRSADVTRSTVQKAVVVISPTARGMGELRERLGVVTAAWFAQEDFSDISILKEFQESLARLPPAHEDGKDHYFGLSLREMIYEFRHQTLALVKCLLLQRKMLFFGSKCERLCMMQFALVSLIPGLIRNLQDAADPSLDSYAQTATSPTSLRTSDRASLLAYMGLPLQIFGKGSFFGPYTPLQQLDILADYDTKSYVVGSTNSLLLQQKERYSDILINLDESNSITITSPSLRTALALSAADRRWIDYLTQTVLDTWDPENPSRPKNLGYAGSEDAIRLQFEEYILSLLSSMAYHVYHESQVRDNVSTSVANIDHYPDPGDTAQDFNPEFLAMWRSTNNFALFHRLTAEHRVFDVIEPRHPTGGALSVEDLQRRFQQGMADLHLDERVRESREQLGRTFASGRASVEAGMARFWAELERQREQRRAGRGVGEDAISSTSTTKENIDPNTATTSASADPADANTAAAVTASTNNRSTSIRDRAGKVHFQRPDTTQLQASAREGAARAGAYFSSWGTWAKERMQTPQQQQQQQQQGQQGKSPGEGPTTSGTSGTAGA